MAEAQGARGLEEEAQPRWGGLGFEGVLRHKADRKCFRALNPRADRKCFRALNPRAGGR